MHLKRNRASPPFIPPNEDNFDQKYANDSWKDENSEIMLKQGEMVQQPAIQALFEGYYYMQLSDINGGPGIIDTSKVEENDLRVPPASSKTTRSNSIAK